MSSVEIAKKIYPLKFLDAYTASDKAYFFGRDEEIEALHEACYNSPLVLLYGASGSGKTSLVQCGLAKKLARHTWLDIYVRKGEDINQSIKASLKKAVNIQSERDYPVERLLKAVYTKSFRTIYLIFDQFEELFLLGTQEEQETFYANVKALLSTEFEVKLIFSIREEFLGHLYPFEKAVPDLFKHRVRVEGMNTRKVASVLEGINALDASVLTFAKGEEEAIAESLVEKLQGERKSASISLPYLQVMLDKLYREQSGDTSSDPEQELCIKKEAIDALAPIDNILQQFLEERIEVIAASSEAEKEKLGSILLTLVTLEGTKQPLSAKEIKLKLTELKGSYVELMLRALESNRILRYRKEEDVYELAHDALALSVAEKRSLEEVELLELRRYIQSKIGHSIGEPISAKMLERILPLISKLGLTADELSLVRTSEESILEAKKRKRLLRNIGMVLTLALVIVLSSLTFWALAASRKAEASASKARIESEKAIVEKQKAIASEKKVFQALEEVKKIDSLRINEEHKASLEKYTYYLDRIKTELEVQLKVDNYSYLLAREYMHLAKELLRENKDFDNKVLEELELLLMKGEASKEILNKIFTAVEQLEWRKVKKLFTDYRNLRKAIGGNLFTKEKQILHEAKVLCEIMDNMVFVEGGSFEMGSLLKEEKDELRHRVELSDYYISKYECTQEQWVLLMENNPSYFVKSKGKYPVEQVSWTLIQDYIKKLNLKTGKTFRLPTEAEWEYAAKGGKRSKAYPYAGAEELGTVAWYDDNSSYRTHEVGEKKFPNELGLYDMSGNVWEWCSDWYGETYYQESLGSKNPQGPIEGFDRVVRGGSYNYSDYECRLENRSNAEPNEIDGSLGFRLVLIK